MQLKHSLFALTLALAPLPVAADTVMLYVGDGQVRGGIIEILGQGSYFIDDDGEAVIDLPPGTYRYVFEFAGRRFEGDINLRGGLAETALQLN